MTAKIEEIRIGDKIIISKKGQLVGPLIIIQILKDNRYRVCLEICEELSGILTIQPSKIIGKICQLREEVQFSSSTIPVEKPLPEGEQRSPHIVDVSPVNDEPEASTFFHALDQFVDIEASRLEQLKW